MEQPIWLQQIIGQLTDHTMKAKQVQIICHGNLQEKLYSNTYKKQFTPQVVTLSMLQDQEKLLSVDILLEEYKMNKQLSAIQLPKINKEKGNFIWKILE